MLFHREAEIIRWNLCSLKKCIHGDFPVVQWLAVYIFNVGGTGLILGWGTNSQYAIGLRQKKKKKKGTHI